MRAVRQPPAPEQGIPQRPGAGFSWCGPDRRVGTLPSRICPATTGSDPPMSRPMFLADEDLRDREKASRIRLLQFRSVKARVDEVDVKVVCAFPQAGSHRYPASSCHRAPDSRCAQGRIAAAFPTPVPQAGRSDPAIRCDSGPSGSPRHVCSLGSHRPMAHVVPQRLTSGDLDRRYPLRSGIELEHTP